MFQKPFGAWKPVMERLGAPTGPVCSFGDLFMVPVPSAGDEGYGDCVVDLENTSETVSRA